MRAEEKKKKKLLRGNVLWVVWVKKKKILDKAEIIFTLDSVLLLLKRNQEKRLTKNKDSLVNIS